MVFSVPALFVCAALLRWDTEPVPGRPRLATVFAYGFLLSVPGLIVLSILDSIVGKPLTGFPAYLGELFRNHLGPAALGLGAYILWQGKTRVPSSDAGVFLNAFAFLSGFYFMLGIADFVALYRQWESGESLPNSHAETLVDHGILAARFRNVPLETEAGRRARGLRCALLRHERACELALRRQLPLALARFGLSCLLRVPCRFRPQVPSGAWPVGDYSRARSPRQSKVLSDSASTA